MKKEKILIGWASRDVTPDGKVALRGQFHVRIAEEINDSLSTTALALENESQTDQAIIISLDAVHVDDAVTGGVRQKLQAKLPYFDPDKLFISVTHTHTAPRQGGGILGSSPKLEGVMSGDDYSDWLIEKISEAAIEAWEKRQPGALSWGRGYAVIGFNRRVAYDDGSTVMYGDPNDPKFSHMEGHEDHGMDMLFTYDTQHKLTGMLINVPCPSQCTEGAYFISADFWHETRDKIQKRHGKDLFILPQCSAAGDLAPRTMLHRDADTRMMELKGYGDDYNMARRKDIADRITAVIDKVLPLVAKDIRDEVELVHQVIKIDLPERLATEEDLAEAEKEVSHYQARLEELAGSDPASFDYSVASRRVSFNQKVIDMYHAQQKGANSRPAELHVLRIGDIAMCTNRFEFYLDFGERIQARSKALQTFVVQLAGAGWYLPSQRSLEGGSYGAIIASTPIGPEGGKIIVENTLEEINKMFEEK